MTFREGGRGHWLSFVLLTCASGGAVAPIGCGSNPQPPPVQTFAFGPKELRDSANCATCHEEHYNDWARSMHAFASDDPVFLAMNARGQRETAGLLGNFCVKCHAPMAVLDGKTTDGLNLAALPKSEKGVTCYFCHNVNSVGASHDNADVGIANDLVLRGEISDPRANAAHAATYSPLQDSQKLQSAQMCGTCHDITTRAGGHIERTFQEWSNTIFATSPTTCAFNGNCHMPSREHSAIVVGGPTDRTFHEHDFAAVDVAFSPTFPATVDEQERKVEANLSTALQGALCVNARGGVRVFLDNATTGHFWPSGAAQDRRAWVEVVAEKNGAPFYSSGSVAPGVPVGSDPNDTDLWILRDQMFDANDNKVAMFWQAACAAGNELKALASQNPMDPGNVTHQERLYPNATLSGDSVLAMMPDKVTLTVHIQPIGLDVLNDLVASKDLDPAVAKQVPTLTVALPNETDGGVRTSLVWTAATASTGYTDGNVPMSCTTTLGFNVNADTRRAANPPSTCPGRVPPNDGGP